MERVLIATTNKDKYETVSKIFKYSIFPSDSYKLEKLTSNMNIPDEKEEGNNIERARRKALIAYEYLKDYGFDYIVGLDDAIFLKGRLEPNIKEYINKILFENYLDNDEEYGFNRAYSIIDKEGTMYEVDIDIPYTFRSLDSDFKVEDHTYPLSKVSCPLGYDKPVCDLTDEERTNYYLDYSKDKLMKLKIKKH